MTHRPGRAFRLLLLLPLLAFASLLIRPSGVLAAAAITLSPSSGPAGSTFTVSGSGYAPNEVVSIGFQSTTGTGTATPIGTGTASPTGTFQANAQVPLYTTAGTYNVTARGNTSGLTASAIFTVTGPSTTLYLTKSVSVDGLAAQTSAGAVPGDTLTYDLRYGDETPYGTGGATPYGSGTLTITDALQPGQTLVSAYSQSGGCGTTTSGSIVTVNCTVLAPGAGSFHNVYITTVVDSGFSGTIPNTATLTGPNGQMLTSNQTTVGVTSTTTPTGPTGFPTGPFNGAFTICGLVTSFVPPGPYNNGSVTIFGQTFAVAAGASFSGFTGVPGNYCVSFGYTNGVITSVTAAPNMAGVYVVCGPVGFSGTGYTVGAYGLPMTGFTGGQFLPGTYTCFLLSPTGAVLGVLSGVPTSIRLLNFSHTYRVNRFDGAFVAE